MCFQLSFVSFSSFAQLCTCALDPEIILALHPEILLRVAGPAELIIVLADVENLEDRRSIRTGEHDRNLPVPVHALAVLLVDRRAQNHAVAQLKAAPRGSLFRLPALGGSAVVLVGLVVGELLGVLDQVRVQDAVRGVARRLGFWLNFLIFCMVLLVARCSPGL